MKLLHSADWQIGAQFRQFGERGAVLGDARLDTLRRALQEAAERRVDAFVIAGDLFEDNQIDSHTVSAVFEIFAEFSSVPIFILPGNHDPFTGPASIWGRRPFSSPPAHVQIFTNCEAVAVGDGYLLASPLTQKRSTTDPSSRLALIAKDLPASAPKAGVTHGSPAIESKHQTDDFPIALDAATRLGLDFLALGHWHSTLTLDGGRMLMPGTPEPTDFSETGAGFVHEVEIRAAGESPRITPVRVAQWHWRTLALDLGDSAHAESGLEQFASEQEAVLEKTVLRVTLTGNASTPAVYDFVRLVENRLQRCGILDITDATTPEFTTQELAGLRQEHPLLGCILNDLDALAAYTAGEALPDGKSPGFTPPEFLALCEAIGCAPADATPEFISHARRVLLRELREVAPGC